MVVILHTRRPQSNVEVALQRIAFLRRKSKAGVPAGRQLGSATLNGPVTLR